jgi:tetratricopeptide (TPR) repeat protein
MAMLRLSSVVLALTLACGLAPGAPLTQAQAVSALDASEPAARLAAIERLAEIGKMPDADRLLPRLDDDDPRLRAAASDAIWRIWSRSGDPAIDQLFARGIKQMQSSAFADALNTFTEIVRRKPGFAEGWNKRATIYFALGENDKSLKDCDEVLKRNPNHFGALVGAGQIHLQLEQPEAALKFFKRALSVNPNMEGPAAIVPMIERQLADKERHTT